MKVFLPASLGWIRKKKEWFESNACKELAKKGVEFGFEIKDFMGGSNIDTDLPFGIHLPYDFVNRITGRETRIGAEYLAHHIADQERMPCYIVLHGMRLGGIREEPPSRERRYVSRFGASEYDYAFNSTVKVCQDLKMLFGLFVKVAIENTPFTDIYQSPIDIIQRDNDKPALETCLRLRVGSLSSDLLALKQEAGCDIVFDFEHSAFSLDFMNRNGFYGEYLKTAEVSLDLSPEEEALSKKCGLVIRPGFVPATTICPGILEEEIECLGADVFHFSGSCACGKWHELCRGKVAHHSPILPGDKNVIRMLEFLKRPSVLKAADPIFVPEACGAGDIPASKHPEMWTSRSANAQRESLEVFCQMLLEIWYK